MQGSVESRVLIDQTAILLHGEERAPETFANASRNLARLRRL